MGAAASNAAQTRNVKPPQDIAEFRKLTGPNDYYVIPEVPEKRTVTDFKFTITFGVCLLLLVPFMIYTFVQSDLDRFVRGYDNCGNICGRNNSRIGDIRCSGQDTTKKPLLLLDSGSSSSYNDYSEEKVRFECVERCDTSQYLVVLNRCIKDSDGTANDIFAEVASDLNKSAGSIVALCFIGLGFSIGMLLLFRYFVAVVVWVILIGSIIGFLILTGVLWYYYSNSTTESKEIRYLAVFFTIASVVLIVMLICMIKRIKLVIRLFRESIKIIFGIPMILLEPLVTFLALAILLIIFAFFLIVWSTAGSLQYTGHDGYRYAPNGAIIFTIIFHCVISVWMIEFIVGCQHMVISGAISAVYFARNKSAVVSPIYNSFYNLVRYHLGTVAFGSLIITVLAIIKALIRSLTNSRQAKVLVDCCLGAVEDFLRYLSKNAYIQTAMHGQPFYKSGKRAVRLLYANAINTIAVNSVGSFVLNMAKVLIVVCTIGVGIAMYDYENVPFFAVGIFIAAFVTAVIADCFFSVFETAVDTIFLCFCEDSCMNDGMERPYYMTTNLMQYMEEAKKTVKDKKDGN